MRRRLTSFVLALVAGLALSACEDAGVVEPASDDEGMQATGTLDGQRIAISRGFPITTLGDCDPEDGADEDLCIAARTIDGLTVTLIVENVGALVEGETLQVLDTTCVAGCDDVTDGVVVDVLADGQRRRAVGGTMDVRGVGSRWVADFDVRLLGTDRLIGTFDVTPTTPEDLTG